MRVEKDYEDLLKLFNRYRVKYCIVGAYALAYYVIPRYTKDLDIFVEVSPANAKRILSALREFGFSGVGLGSKDFCQCAGKIQN